MIKVGILGYGNLGRGVESALAQNADMELVGVFTRRDPASLKVASGAPVYHTDDAEKMKEQIDVMIICGGSATDLPKMTPKYAEMFNVVDSFDTHAHIPEHFAAVDAAAKKAGKIGMISCGWDPGMFSLNRVYANAILPEGKDYTFWGRGVSQGHSDAIRRIEGVKDARQYTCPVESAVEAVRAGKNPELTTRDKHTRECFVVAEEGADLARIENEIKTMPNYFDEYEDHRTLYLRGRAAARPCRPAARRLCHPCRQDWRRLPQAHHRVQPQAGLQPRVHRLGSGCLRTCGLPHEQGRSDRRQDHAGYRTGLPVRSVR